MKYTIITIGIVTSMLCLGAYSFAQFDCGLSDKAIIMPYVNDASQGPFDKEALEMASKHLNNYCGKSLEEGAESPYLFDQLLDIGFRKLDAIPGKTYGLTPDTKGTERQNKITTFAGQFSDPGSGETPVKQNTLGEFIADFTTYWPTTSVGISASAAPHCAVQNYDTLPLYNRYIATCEIALCISNAIVQITNTTDANTDTSKTLLTDDLCTSIATNRFITESIQTKQLITRVGIRAITSNISSYSENYFIGNRRQGLFDKMTLFDQYMTFVNHKVQEGTPSCSK